MSGIPDDPTKRHPEKPGDFPAKSVNGHDRADSNKSAKTDDVKTKKPEEKQKPESKH